MPAKLLWHDAACEEYVYWHTHDKQVVKRIPLLIKDTQRNGYAGIGYFSASQYAKMARKRFRAIQ